MADATYEGRAGGLDAMQLRNRKILIIGVNYSPELTGIAPYTSSLAQYLHEKGSSVSVITTYPHYPEWKKNKNVYAESQRDEEGGPSVRRVNHYVPSLPSPLRRILMELSFGARVVLCRWSDYDIVLSVSPSLFASGMALARSRACLRSNRKPFGIWVQDLYSVGMQETGMGGSKAVKVVAWLESRILRAATGVVVIHEKFADTVIEQLKCQKEKTVVVRNWVHLSESNMSADGDVRSKFGWGPDDLVVLHAGNMGVKQGLENVIAAARVAENRGRSQVRIVLVGSGGERMKLHALSAELPNIQIMDPVENELFGKMLSAADILLVNELPGVREMAVPSKLTSYFSSGKAVLCASDPESITTKEVRSSRGGLCIQAGDPEQLVDAIERLQDDPVLARSLGDAGRKYAIEVLGARRALGKLEEWLEGLG